MVVGAVGCGKSSLLAALLGEMRLVQVEPLKTHAQGPSSHDGEIHHLQFLCNLPRLPRCASPHAKLTQGLDLYASCLAGALWETGLDFIYGETCRRETGWCMGGAPTPHRRRGYKMPPSGTTS